MLHRACLLFTNIDTFSHRVSQCVICLYKSSIQWCAIMIIILHLFLSLIWGAAFIPVMIFLYCPLKRAPKPPLSPSFEKSKIHQLGEAVDNFE